jgi:hypothetical protein
MRMTVPLPIILSIILLGLMLLFILRLWLKRFRNHKEWWLFISGSLPGFVLFLLIGPWAFISIHLRWAFLALYIAAAIIAYRKAGAKPSKRPRTTKRFILKRVFFLLFFGIGIFLYFQSRTYKGEPVHLNFPLKQGKYYVMQGGSNFLSNPFHTIHYLLSFRMGKDIRYAMDIARLNGWGGRAASVYSKDLKNYQIFDDSVYAPCEGTIIHIEDGIQDNVPAGMQLEKPYGNHVIIQGKDYRVILGHLRKGSIQVQKGNKVVPGRLLARLGNSGKTIEPHLHIDAVRNYIPDDLESGEPAPIIFGGRFYTINDIIQGK